MDAAVYLHINSLYKSFFRYKLCGSDSIKLILELVKKSVKIPLPSVKLKLTREGKKMTRRIKRDPKKQELIKQLVSEYGVEKI